MGIPKLSIKAGLIELLDGVRKVFSTTLLSIARIPAAAITLSGYNVTFPDPVKDFLYYHSSTHTSTHRAEFVEMFVTAPPQKWGPAGAEGITNTLADILLGTVPSDSDYLDVQLTLNSRTTYTYTFCASSLPPLVEPGKQTQLLGGSCPLEEGPNWARSMDIVLGPDNGDGTKSVYLRRWQSMAAADPQFTGSQYTPQSVVGNPIYAIGGSVYTTTSPSDVWGYGSANQIATYPTTDPTNFGATFNFDLVITPGYINVGSPTLKKPFAMVTDQLLYGTVPTASSYSATMNFGPADANRWMVLSIVATNLTTGTLAVSSVSIGGVAASIVVQTSSSSGTAFATAIAIAKVPSGTSGTVTVNFSGSATSNIKALGLQLTAMYNPVSSGPVATLSRGTSGGTGALATAAGGVAVAAVASGSTPDTLVGIEHGGTTEQMGWQQTDGTTLNIGATTGGGNQPIIAAASWH